ncbi:MAG TPA: fumarylacetoacetate hydrolase family protein [Ktedonobacteraceae bacterium]|nr:fumarylacetoacetate hydrolase family protein [Ktedonobacteraceae bacterium]
MKYQLGTALVAGRESIILYCRDAFFDLSSLLKLVQSKQALSLERVNPPVSLMEVMERWPFWKGQLASIADWLAGDSFAGTLPAQVGADQLSWRAPLLYPHKLICIGTNYKDHILEMSGGAGMKLPAYPYSFLKPTTTTLIGSGEPFTLPKYAEFTDYEAELAVVIGQRARNVRGDEALHIVAGYSVFNDLSVRDWITKPAPVGIDWVLSKAFDGSAPMGPFITPAEFVPDPQNLLITLSVNGQVKQDSNTANMVFSVREIIEHLASIMTLEPGDVIATGTPAGVGYARRPQEPLRPGDEIAIEIEGLGRLETPVQS